LPSLLRSQFRCRFDHRTLGCHVVKLETSCVAFAAVDALVNFGSNLIKVHAIGRENDDHNPPRIASRSLFDLSLGHDNLFHGDNYKWSAHLTVINLANNYALYNFLSTFSGTHYVAPRTLTAELGFHF
jgi:hypothetical protein